MSEQDSDYNDFEFIYTLDLAVMIILTYLLSFSLVSPLLNENQSLCKMIFCPCMSRTWWNSVVNNQRLDLELMETE